MARGLYGTVAFPMFLNLQLCFDPVWVLQIWVVRMTSDSNVDQVLVVVIFTPNMECNHSKSFYLS